MANNNIIHLVSIAVPYRYGIQDMTRPPSGILYVGATLKQHNFDVILHHIKEKDLESCVKDIAEKQAAWVGFSVMTGAQISASAKMSSALKQAIPDLPIVWGGIHPSLMPEETLRMETVDYVVIGEGENTVLELAQNIAQENKTNLNKINGLSYRNNGEIVINTPRQFEKNIDKFSQCWSLVDINRYVRPVAGGKSFCFITSRGCPHSCGFCYNQAFNRKKWRAHSVDFVVSQLRAIKESTGISCVIFDDDNFFTNRARGLEILKGIKEIGITCLWVDLRVDYIEEDLIAQLVDLGVKSIFMGWESGSDKTLARINKGFNSALILEKTKILSKFPELNIDASAIVGFPWENEKDMQKTVSLALKMFRLKPFLLNFNLGIYIPYPGSPIISEAFERGFAFPKESEGWRKFDILSGEMELPWLTKSIVKKYTLIDRYAKLLYVSSKRNWWKAFIAYSLAMFAYLRLKTGLIGFPFEIWLSDWYRKRMIIGSNNLTHKET